ncbi:hypothetical protein GGF31_001149 [Allomyces arbusculus]|nr:hypothetical protein GGF31_001149 [Allomyces arbusculus]
MPPKRSNTPKRPLRTKAELEPLIRDYFAQNNIPQSAKQVAQVVNDQRQVTLVRNILDRLVEQDVLWSLEELGEVTVYYPFTPTVDGPEQSLDLDQVVLQIEALSAQAHQYNALIDKVSVFERKSNCLDLVQQDDALLSAAATARARRNFPDNFHSKLRDLLATSRYQWSRSQNVFNSVWPLVYPPLLHLLAQSTDPVEFMRNRGIVTDAMAGVDLSRIPYTSPPPGMPPFSIRWP